MISFMFETNNWLIIISNNAELEPSILSTLSKLALESANMDKAHLGVALSRQHLFMILIAHT